MAALGSPINPSNSIQMYERLKKESKSDYNRNYDTLQNAQIVENSKEKSECSKIMNHNKKETDESVPYERLHSKPSQCQNVYDTLQNKEKGEYFTQQSFMSKACGKIGQNDIKVERIPGYETLNSAREQDKSYDILKKSQIGDNTQTQSVESKERRQDEPILKINAIGTIHASQKSEHSYCSPLYDMKNIDLEQEQSYAYASFPSKTQNKKDKSDKTAKHQTCKQIASFLLGMIFGGAIFAIIAFAVLRKKIQNDNNGNSILPGNGTGNNSSCVWVPWTEWSDCSVLCGNGTQHRNRQHRGETEGCLPRNENQTKSCNFGVTGCQAPAPAIDMRFDPATLNSQGFLSTDNSILSNRYSSQTPKRSSGGDKSLQLYSGVIANRCFGGKKKVWFKVAYKYTINNFLSFTNLILEVGVADRGEIDKDVFVGNVQTKGWSFALARCGENNDNVCLRSKHLENLQDNIIFSRNSVGLHKNGTYDMVLDRQNNTFQLKDLSAPYLNISFINVVSANELCPVFGVYHSNLLDVQIQILDSKDFT